jgi:cellulose synthase/poly-beta-1,6-N-acetylglucosamine synthase-like glycosyltransferase
MILDSIAGLSLLVMLATWIGYPAAVWAISRMRRVSAQPARDALPSVSVVIASRESAHAIRARVDNCLDTGYPASSLEVVVALDRSVTPADEALFGGGNERVRVVASIGRGKAAALNTGVNASTGSVLVFADTWQRYEVGAIAALIAELADPRVGAVSGSLQLPPGRASLTRAYWTYERWLRRCEARVHSTIGATGAVYALRRELWRPLPAGLLLDDVYAPMQVILGGRRVAFAENARAAELRASVPRQEYQRKVRTLTGVLQVCAWLPVLLWPHRNPVWAQFVMHKLARMATPYALVAMGLWLAVHGAPLLVPFLIPSSAVLLAGAAWATFGRSTGARRTRDVMVEGTLLQVAVITAGVNGFRGRWEVWNG